MKKSQRQDLTAFMAIAQMVAEVDAGGVPTSDADRRSAERAAQAMRERHPSGAPRARVQSLTRAAALAELDALRAAFPSLQFAHRDLTYVSDDDVRSALEDALFVLDER